MGPEVFSYKPTNRPRKELSPTSVVLLECIDRGVPISQVSSIAGIPQAEVKRRLPGLVWHGHLVKECPKLGAR